MWRRVEVRNFKSIEAVRADLAPLTVLVGPNGSGKSNFVDALVFARDVAFDAALAIERRRGIQSLRRWQPAKPGAISIDVRAARTRGKLTSDYVRHAFTIAGERGHHWTFRRELIEVLSAGRVRARLRRDGKQIVERVPEDLPAKGLASTASAMLFARQMKGLKRTRALTEVRCHRLIPEEMRRLQVPTESARLDESGANLATALQDVLRSPEGRESLLSTMRKIVPGLEDISVERLDEYLSVKFTQAQAAGEKARFAALDMSEGALRALGIIVAAHQMSDDELLVIEEPEVSIHPSAAHVLFDVLRTASRRGAVLVTTHSPDLLDAVSCGQHEEILVCDYREGTTRIGPMSEAQRRMIEDKLFTAGEIMRAEPLRIEGAPPEVFVPHRAVAALASVDAHAARP